MNDIVYFQADFPEPSDKPAGYPIAELVRKKLQFEGFHVSEIAEHWQASWLFTCIINRKTFQVEVTPYYEVVPIEYSLSFKPDVGSIRRLVGPNALNEQERLSVVINELLHGDTRFGRIEWKCLKKLKLAARDRT